MPRVRTMTAGLCATLLAGVVGASPAQAAPDTVSYLQGQKCLTYLERDRDGSAFMTECGNYQSVKWGITNKGTLNGHQLVQLQNRGNNRCLDSHAASDGGSAWVIGCNTGNWQIWEVFINANGTRVFKSYGHWIHRQQHMCLSRVARDNNTVNVRVCDANSASQQFIRQPW